VTSEIRSAGTAGAPGSGPRARAAAERSGSSFYWAMRLMPRPKREAMFAIYAFCRAVDDVADGDEPRDAKLAGLAGWRTEVGRMYAGRPTTPVGRDLVGPIAEFGLDKADFLAVIDGMEMDARGDMVAPAMADLELYCARVAGAVGLLSIRVFGAHEPRARDVALGLGEALQLTNILRDLKEDAERGRLYLPDELLARHEVAARDPGAVLSHPNLPLVCTDLAEVGIRAFDRAEAAVKDCRRRPMRPAVVMMKVYRRILDRLVRRGWRELDRPIRLAPEERVWVALRHGLL